MTAGRALVTGATGFVGTALVRRLVADGWDVDALVRTNDATLPEGVRSRVIAESVDGVIELVAKIGPTHCFHLATAFR
ncbi:MAG: NAD-dependent epimerase/dehydratase family protein, partial [Acidimicrobiia bacterium]